MRLICIACEALARPLYLCAARSPHMVDMVLVERGLHTHPATLRAHLQELIDRAAEKPYAAIALGYGLCGKATAGLTAPAIPIVIPRAHDCITLFLGSRQRYQEQFTTQPGTYWYAQDYIERDDGTGSALSMGSGSDLDLETLYVEYVKKYGRDNADYLIEAMGGWQSHYQRAVYIDMGVSDGAAVAAKAQAQAARRGWAFERMTGDLILLRRLLDGDWSTDANGDFLVLQPGQRVALAYDERVIDCVSSESS